MLYQGLLFSMTAEDIQRRRDVERLIDLMMPVAEMGYTQVLPVASVRFAIVCMVRYVGLKWPRLSNHLCVQLLASEGSLVDRGF